MLWQRNFLASMGIFGVQPLFCGSVNHIAIYCPPTTSLSQGPAPYTAMWHGSWIRSKAVTLGITGPTMDLQLLRTIGATRHHRGTSNRLGNDDISICYRNKYHSFGVFLQINPRHIYNIYIYLSYFTYNSRRGRLQVSCHFIHFPFCLYHTLTHKRCSTFTIFFQVKSPKWSTNWYHFRVAPLVPHPETWFQRLHVWPFQSTSEERALSNVPWWPRSKVSITWLRGCVNQETLQVFFVCCCVYFDWFDLNILWKIPKNSLSSWKTSTNCWLDTNL